MIPRPASLRHLYINPRLPIQTHAHAFSTWPHLRSASSRNGNSNGNGNRHGNGKSGKNEIRHNAHGPSSISTSISTSTSTSTNSIGRKRRSPLAGHQAAALKQRSGNSGNGNISNNNPPSNVAPSNPGNPGNPNDDGGGLPDSGSNNNNGNSLERMSVPKDYPQALAIPLTRRPLFPGFYKSLYIKNNLVGISQKLKT
jgi:Lon-like ATP-dependent protease